MGTKYQNQKYDEMVQAIEKYMGNNYEGDKEDWKEDLILQYNFACKLAKEVNASEEKTKAVQEAIGKSQTSDYIQGKKVPNINQVHKTSQALDIPVEYMLGLSKSKVDDRKISAVSDYLGLSSDAIIKLHKDVKNKKKSLQMDILSYLIVEGQLTHLLEYLETSLVNHLHYKRLYGELDRNDDITMELQEYNFQKIFSKMYTDCIDTLSEKYYCEIDTVSKAEWMNYIDAAITTREKMDEIIDNAFSDEDKLKLYNDKKLEEVLKDI